MEVKVTWSTHQRGEDRGGAVVSLLRITDIGSHGDNAPLLWVWHGVLSYLKGKSGAGKVCGANVTCAHTSGSQPQQGEQQGQLDSQAFS